MCLFISNGQPVTSVSNIIIKWTLQIKESILGFLGSNDMYIVDIYNYKTRANKQTK